MRSDPTIIVTCDKCQRSTEELGLCPLSRGAYDERHIDDNLEHRGWKVDDSQDICPECQEEAPSDKG